MKMNCFSFSNLEKLFINKNIENKQKRNASKKKESLINYMSKNTIDSKSNTKIKEIANTIDSETKGAVFNRLINNLNKKTFKSQKCYKNLITNGSKNKTRELSGKKKLFTIDTNKINSKYIFCPKKKINTKVKNILTNTKHKILSRSKNKQQPINTDKNTVVRNNNKNKNQRNINEFNIYEKGISKYTSKNSLNKTNKNFISLSYFEPRDKIVNTEIEKHGSLNNLKKKNDKRDFYLFKNPKNRDKTKKKKRKSLFKSLNISTNAKNSKKKVKNINFSYIIPSNIDNSDFINILNHNEKFKLFSDAFFEKLKAKKEIKLINDFPEEREKHFIDGKNNLTKRSKVDNNLNSTNLNLYNNYINYNKFDTSIQSNNLKNNFHDSVDNNFLTKTNLTKNINKNKNLSNCDISNTRDVNSLIINNYKSKGSNKHYSLIKKGNYNVYRKNIKSSDLKDKLNGVLSYQFSTDYDKEKIKIKQKENSVKRMKNMFLLRIDSKKKDKKNEKISNLTLVKNETEKNRMIKLRHIKTIHFQKDI